jgi:hypothetical protein
LVVRQIEHLQDPWFDGQTTELTKHIIELGNYTPVREPLMLSTQLSTASQQPMARHLQSVFDSADWQQLLQDAELIEAAFLRLLTFVRSRIPGYPLLRVPQLTRGSYYTANELGFKVPWLQYQYNWALQQQRSPDVHQVLEVDAHSHDDHLTELIEGLTSTEPWQRFAALRRELRDADREVLSNARLKLTARLSEIDSFEPRLMMGRLEYRRHHTAEVVAEMPPGRAKDYAVAFGDIDALIELVAVSVFGQLVVHDLPRRLARYSEFSVSESTVRVTIHEYLSVGSLAYVPDTPIGDAIHVTSVSLFQSADRSGTNISGTVLAGSGAAWNLANNS